MAAMGDLDAAMQEVRDLVTRTRDVSLWFLKKDYMPDTPSQALSILDKIMRHANRSDYVQARRLKEWLSRSSSGTSSR